MIVSLKKIRFCDYILVSIMSPAGSMDQMLFFFPLNSRNTIDFARYETFSSAQKAFCPPSPYRLRSAPYTVYISAAPNLVPAAISHLCHSPSRLL